MEDKTVLNLIKYKSSYNSFADHNKQRDITEHYCLKCLVMFASGNILKIHPISGYFEIYRTIKLFVCLSKITVFYYCVNCIVNWYLLLYICFWMVENLLKWRNVCRCPFSCNNGWNEHPNSSILQITLDKWILLTFFLPSECLKVQQKQKFKNKLSASKKCVQYIIFESKSLDTLFKHAHKLRFCIKSQ